MKAKLTCAAVAAGMLACVASAKDSILYFAAHPDDTEGGAATLFQLKDAYDIHIVDLTRGERGLGEAGYRDGTTAAKREQEESAACALLGAKSHHFLDEVDGEACASAAAVKKAADLIRTYKPRAIFSHWPVDNHPDHVQCDAVVRHAVSATGWRGEYYYYEVNISQTANYNPLYYVDVTSTMSNKLEMIRCYACQNQNDSLAQLTSVKAACRGQLSPKQCTYAETFASWNGLPYEKGILDELPGARAAKRADVLVAERQAFRTGARIAFMGDSITQNGWNNADGYVRLVARALEILDTGCTVIPAGVSGNKSPDMLKRLDKDVLSKKPDIVLFSCGVNDVWHGMADPAKGVSCEDYAKNCGEILDRIAAAGSTPVVLTPTMIGESVTTPENVKLETYIRALRAVAAVRGVQTINLNAAMREALKTTPANRGGKRLTFDGVHMNYLGDRMMAWTILLHFGLTGVKDDEIVKGWEALHLNTASVGHIEADGRPLDFDVQTGLPKGVELPKLPFDLATARASGVTRLGGRTLMSRISAGDWICDIRGTIGRLGETVWNYDFTYRGEERSDLAVETVVPPESSPTLEAIKRAGLKLTKIDWYFSGFRRFYIDFDGWEGWIIEPKSGTVKAGNPWVWCMKWPGAFAEYSGQIHALRRGYHYVYLDNKLWMSEEGTKKAKAWRDLLVNRIGLAEKVNLIGMSWGGFFSTRYVGTYPQDVAKVYLDNPVMSFHHFSPWGWDNVSAAWGGKKGDGHDWKSDPRMPINLAGPIAAAKIPVLLLYGDKDTVCVPEENCLIFVERFKQAGGDITVVCRPGKNHHPHGYAEKDGGDKIVDFFE